MEFQTHSCVQCGKRFRVACLSELEEKIKNHVCLKINKRVARTAKLKQGLRKRVVQDTVVNRVEQHNFDRLVARGMIVEA